MAPGTKTELIRPRYLPPGIIPKPPLFKRCGTWSSILRLLYERWGDPYWWPGNSAWEVALGAVLTQNTAWKNVEKAISNLSAEGLLSPSVILQTPSTTLEQAIAPSGYFRQKTRKIVILSSWWVRSGETVNHNQAGYDHMRSELLSLWGVGPETADSILCYGFGFPCFVVDAYTKRMIRRLRGTATDLSYDEIQHEVHQQLPEEPFYFNLLHGLIVELGKQHCRSRNPQCVDCPLLSLCMHGKTAIR